MLNKVMLIGRLGADPEVRYMPNGKPVARLSVATTRRWKDRQTGERREDTEWHRVIFFARLAEIAGEYLRKGSLVYVEGRIRTQKWQGQDGQDRYTTEIVADNMNMLDSRSGGTATHSDDQQSDSATKAAASAPKPPSPSPSSEPPPYDDDFDDDIPF